MKKLITLFFALMLIISLSACNNRGNEETNAMDSNIQSTNNDNQSLDDNQPTVNTQEITFEQVDNHPVNPENDFMISLLDEENAIIIEYVGADEIVTIPAQVKGYKVVAIKKYVFANDTAVKGVKLADTIEYIEEGCFGLNQNLQIFIGGAGLTKIESGAFQNCINLTEVHIRSDLEELGAYALSDCEKLTRVELPESLITIDETAFFSSCAELVFVCKEGSVVEQFAKEQGFKFEAN